MRIAVIVPCFQEEKAVATVVNGFRSVLPSAAIYVYDNNSTDATVDVARAAGAIVRSEPLKGKGNVVRRMFADVDADIYVLVDGDATYDPTSAPGMIRRLVERNLDMVVGTRLHDNETGSFRRGHQFGNHLLTGVVGWLFGNRFSDMLSGYRVFSRRFVKSFPALSRNFEIETELTVHALSLQLPIDEIVTPYGARPEGSVSKLNTFRDGARILLAILHLCKSERPFFFFGVLGAALAFLSVALATPVIIEFVHTGLVPRFPTAILASAIMLSALLSLTCGAILDTVTHGRRENRRLHYLAQESLLARTADAEQVLARLNALGFDKERARDVDARNTPSLTAASL